VVNKLYGYSDSNLKSCFCHDGKIVFKKFFIELFVTMIDLGEHSGLVGNFNAFSTIMTIFFQPVGWNAGRSSKFPSYFEIFLFLLCFPSSFPQVSMHYFFFPQSYQNWFCVQ